jgi:acetyltransferase
MEIFLPMPTRTDGVPKTAARRPATKAAPRRAKLKPTVGAYPAEWERIETLKDGTPFLLRPLVPADADELRRQVSRSDPEDMRLRFFSPIKQISDTLLERLIRLDYDRTMALVAIGKDAAGAEEGWGVARLSADEERTEAEFAVAVFSDMKGRGLGRLLMARLIEYARARGFRRLYGDVLRENTPMLGLCQAIGFEIDGGQVREPGVVHLSLDLTKRTRTRTKKPSGVGIGGA